MIGSRTSFLKATGTEAQDDPGRVWMNLSEMTASPQQDCVRCHAAYPFATPRMLHHREVARRYRAQPKHFGGDDAMAAYFAPADDRLVPKNFQGKDRGHKYVVVRADLFRYYGRGSWTPSSLQSPEVKACTGCHRLGKGFFPARVALQSFDLCDREAPWNDLCSGLDPRSLELKKISDHPDLYHAQLPALLPIHHKAMSYLYEKCYIPTDQQECK